ncbi:MAG: hypothetical protein QXE97_03185 [Candidatus Aenigmatarchaeota archaeon]
MEREEDIEVEFQSTLEEIKEKTGFKKECILDLFIFELCRREKKHIKILGNIQSV